MNIFPETLKIILLLFPGLIALLVDEMVTGSRKDRNSPLERLFIAVIYAFPAWLLTFGLLLLNSKIGFKFDSAVIEKGFTLELFLFLFVYFFCSVIAGTIIGYMMATQAHEHSLLSRVISFMRKRLGRPDVSGGISPWDKLFCNRERKVIEIIRPDGTSEKGFLKDFTFAGEEIRELSIEGMDVVEKWSDYLSQPKYVYYHFNSGTFVKIFDISEYKKAIGFNGRAEKESKKG
ncbi:MAG: hypothetical protein H0Z35_09250 [Thermoanaerobacteraceae bacterium]|nr:hypothetical protein [Thermoanaerobacteraceae bacterium]